MLTEIRNCLQVPGEPRRRWFADENDNLIVWYHEDGRRLGFQLCYGKEGEQRALTWIEGRGYTHRRVDTGESLGYTPDSFTPILVPDGHFPREQVEERFLAIAGDMEADLRDWIVAVMEMADL